MKVSALGSTICSGEVKGYWTSAITTLTPAASRLFGTVTLALTASGDMPWPWLQLTFGTPLTSAITLVIRICKGAEGNGFRIEPPTVKMSLTSLPLICGV